MRSLSTFISIFFSVSTGLFSQNNDCVNAVVICDNNQIVYNPSGPGIDDFANPNNDSGCLADFPIAENQSAWYYFEFRPDMPSNSQIIFTIHPDVMSNQDYDFAVFGPDLPCDNLGSPLRCSYSGQDGDTGLSFDATDTSEPASGDRFVSAITVQPGQGFYLVVDNFSDNSTGFSMIWGGSAAAYLDCDASPECDIVMTQPGTLQLCASPEPVSLSVSVLGTQGETSYEWTATNGGTAYLSSTSVASPILSIPTGVSGDFTFTLSVTDYICTRSIDLPVSVSPPLNVTINGDTNACEGEAVTLTSSGSFASYQWSTGATASSINVTQAGNYSLIVTDNNNCTGMGTADISFNPLPQPQITGEDDICAGTSAILDAGSGYQNYVWSNGESSEQISVSDAGSYSVTVTDSNGCQGTDAKSLVVIPAPVFQIVGADIICKGDSTVLSVDSAFDSYQYQWSNGDDTPMTEVSEPGLYQVTVTNASNCASSESFLLNNSDMQIDYTKEDPVCFGDNTGLVRIDQVTGGKAPYQYSWDGEPYDVKNFISGLVAGDYSLRILDGAGCEITEQFTVEEGFDLTLELEGEANLTLGDETAIRARVNVVDDSISSIQWYPTELFTCVGCLEQDILPLNSQIIFVEVEDERGCKATTELNLFVDKPRNVFVPSAFSPNDDGINDKLSVFTGKDVEKILNFTVFDRWGEVLYDNNKMVANDFNSGWEGGVSKGYNTGTYIYSVEVLFIDGVKKRFTGEVHLLR